MRASLGSNPALRAEADRATEVQSQTHTHNFKPTHTNHLQERHLLRLLLCVFSFACPLSSAGSIAIAIGIAIAFGAGESRAGILDAILWASLSSNASEECERVASHLRQGESSENTFVVVASSLSSKSHRSNTTTTTNGQPNATSTNPPFPLAIPKAHRRTDGRQLALEWQIADSKWSACSFCGKMEISRASFITRLPLKAACSKKLHTQQVAASESPALVGRLEEAPPRSQTRRASILAVYRRWLPAARTENRISFDSLAASILVLGARSHRIAFCWQKRK